MNRPYHLNRPNVLQMDGAAQRQEDWRPVSIRCPHCRQLGSFEKIGGSHTYSKFSTDSQGKRTAFQFGVVTRNCPNPDCMGLVFTVMENTQVHTVLPPELIEFSTDHIPSDIVSALTEAVACHAASAYRATAIMVRRVLELICENKGAIGATLHHRLQSLRSLVVLPPALFTAMDDLKLLGNDAAHVELKAYDNITRDEATAALEVVKEILKALYQLDYITKMLANLKRPKP